MSETGGVGRFRRRWLTLAETAAALDTDEEGVLQAFQAGAAQQLPVYVLSGKANFSGLCSQLQFAFRLHDNAEFREALCDRDGRVALDPRRARGEKWERWFQLIGAFRILPSTLRRIAREREMPVCPVAPGSWWADDSLVAKNGSGDPVAWFNISLYDRVTQTETPVSFASIRFRAEDVRAVVESEDPLRAPSPDSVAPPAKWPWGNHDTGALQQLEAAGKRFWGANYDPEDPTSAETNETVALWLMKEHKVSKRLATAMASILRADGLPSGPRK